MEKHLVPGRNAIANACALHAALQAEAKGDGLRFPPPPALWAGAAGAAGVKAVLADEFMPEAAADACSELGVTTHGRRQDPLALLSIGCTRLAAGKTIEAADLLPLYPREPEAVRRWREAR